MNIYEKYIIKRLAGSKKNKTLDVAETIREGISAKIQEYNETLKAFQNSMTEQIEKLTTALGDINYFGYY